MADKSIKLTCVSNALVKGKVVKAGETATYEAGLAGDLLASKRFVKATSDEGKVATDKASKDKTPTKSK